MLKSICCAIVCKEILLLTFLYVGVGSKDYTIMNVRHSECVTFKERLHLVLSTDHLLLYKTTIKHSCDLLLMFRLGQVKHEMR